MKVACYPAMANQPGSIVIETEVLHQFQELCEEMNKTSVAVLNLLLLRLQRGALERAAYLRAMGEHCSCAVNLLKNLMRHVGDVYEEAVEQSPATKSKTA